MKKKGQNSLSLSVYIKNILTIQQQQPNNNILELVLVEWILNFFFFGKCSAIQFSLVIYISFFSLRIFPEKKIDIFFHCVNVVSQKNYYYSSNEWHNVVWCFAVCLKHFKCSKNQRKGKILNWKKISPEKQQQHSKPSQAKRLTLINMKYEIRKTKIVKSKKWWWWWSLSVCKTCINYYYFF